MKKIKLNVSKKVRSLIIEVFRIGKKKPKKYDSENIQNWDSLSHMILIEKIEKFFNISVKTEDIEFLQSEKKIIKFLSRLNQK